MHYRSCQSPHIPLEDCLIYNPVSAKAKTTIYSVFPLLASAIALTHPFLDGAFLAISLFPEYHPDALILFQSVKLASIKPKNPLLFNTDIPVKIFADISIGRIKYMNGVNKVFTCAIINIHTNRKTACPRDSKRGEIGI